MKKILLLAVENHIVVDLFTALQKMYPTYNYEIEDATGSKYHKYINVVLSDDQLYEVHNSGSYGRYHEISGFCKGFEFCKKNSAV